MSARFHVKRHPVELANMRSPWILRDKARPAFVGHYARLDLALNAIGAKLREERGLAPAIDFTVDEILEAMQYTTGCTRPSGDGPLAWPCPTHSSTVAGGEK